MIHPTSYVAPSASISTGVTIGPYCHVGDGVKIMNDVEIAAHVIIEDHVEIGQHSRLFSFAKIGDGSHSVHIGERCTIREFCQIGVHGRSKHPVIIHDNVYVMAYAQLNLGVQVGEHTVITNTVMMYDDAKCEERVIIGGLSEISEGITVGTGVMIGGASHLHTNIPPFCLVEGNPANVKGLNIIGLRRRFTDKDDINSVKSTFKALYKENFSSELADTIQNSLENTQAKRLAFFVANHQC